MTHILLKCMIVYPVPSSSSSFVLKNHEERGIPNYYSIWGGNQRDFEQGANICLLSWRNSWVLKLFGLAGCRGRWDESKTTTRWKHLSSLFWKPVSAERVGQRVGGFEQRGKGRFRVLCNPGWQRQLTRREVRLYLFGIKPHTYHAKPGVQFGIVFLIFHFTVVRMCNTTPSLLKNFYVYDEVLLPYRDNVVQKILELSPLAWLKLYACL